MHKQDVAIIGGGPSSLLLAAHLDPQKFSVTIYEKNKSLGQKFMVAGKGGFNLTHSEELEDFIQRYLPASFISLALRQFSNSDLRSWLSEIDIPTFIGTSGRVYPEKGIKPVEVLNAIKSVIEQKGVQLKFGYEWKGWTDENALEFADGTIVKADKVVFALGGGSWKVTGSDGSWTSRFKDKGIHVEDFVASNCGFKIDWPNDFIQNTDGKPLKNIAITCKEKSQKGEVVITKFGLEGNAIYALSPEIQEELKGLGRAKVIIDLKPMLDFTQVLSKLERSNKKITDILKRDLKLDGAQINLLKSFTSKEEFTDLKVLANKIKQLPITVSGSAPLDEAISTMGGVALQEVSENYELKKIPNQYCIGEALSWNAPTGGYLLQGCFSMGVFLANHLNE